MLKKSFSVLLALLMSISIVTTVPFSVNGEESSGNTTETVKEETKNLNVGDIIEFGSYPQKRVIGTQLLSELNAIDAPLISYGYVDNYGEVNMGYADVTYNGVKYRKVYAENAIPRSYGTATEAQYGYISRTGTYKIDEAYWFTYEPIKWKVISIKGDGVTVLAERNLDTSIYDRVKLYQSWNESYLRNWLNEKFYSIAFSDDEKSVINSTKHHNQLNQTDNKDYDYATDKLWIPTKSEYESDTFTMDNTPSTAYARCNGYDSYSWINSIDSKGYVADYKSTSDYYYVAPDSYCVGVRPIMTISKDTKVNVAEKYQPTEQKKYYADNYVYTLDENNEATLVEAYGEEESVTLPETLDGKTVVGIGEDILKYNNNIKELTIPDSYKNISCKFKSKTLETVHIGSGVTDINKFAFTYSTNMQNVFVSNDNKFYRDVEGVLCLRSTILYYPVGRKDTSYTIPKSAEGIVEGAGFLNAINLEKVYCRDKDDFEIDYNQKSLGYYKEDTYDYYDVSRNTNFVIYGDYGSNIHKYANHCSIPFVDIKSGKEYKPNPEYDLYDFKVLSDGTAEITKFNMNIFAEKPSLNVLSEIYGYKVTKVSYNFLEYNFASSYKYYNIEKIVLPDTVTQIPNSAFYNDTYLKEIEFSSDINYIGEKSFMGCTNLKKIPKLNSITEIKYRAFYNCSSLENVNIPFGVTKIGEDAFYNCKSLKEIILPESVSSIGSYAFSNCKSVKEFNIPKNVTYLNDGLFYNCKSLKSMVIDENITGLGKSLFKNCTSLEEVYIPYTIKSIGIRIFDNCSSLGGIYVDSNNSVYTDINGILVNKEKTKLMLYPAGRTSKTYTVPNGITSFSKGAFTRADNLEKVIFQDGVESLSDELFYKSKGIKSVEFSDSIKTINSKAFYGCTSLEEISIPDSVTKLGTGVFTNCTSLKKAVIPYSIFELSDSTFYNCSSLEDVTLENVKKIGRYAFKGTGLKKIVLDTSVEDVAVLAFLDCKQLRRVTCLNRNVDLKLNSIGYVTSDNGEYFYRKGIIDITGYKGSTAEKLTQEVKLFRFFDIEAPTTPSTTTPTVVNPTKLTLNKKNIVLTKYNKNTATVLKATVTPTNASSKGVVWKSSNPKVAKVDSKGKVTTVSKGTCIITASSKADSKVKATCKVTVIQKVVSVKLSAKNKTIKKGKSFTLRATVLPTNANMKSVTFTSSNKKVATVNSKGKVVGKKAGKTTIIVTTKDGKKKAKCIVTVK